MGGHPSKKPPDDTSSEKKKRRSRTKKPTHRDRRTPKKPELTADNHSPDRVDENEQKTEPIKPKKIPDELLNIPEPSRDIPPISDEEEEEEEEEETNLTEDEFVEIQVKDPDAFAAFIVEQRQQAIDNLSYRTSIESWRPKTLEHLADLVRKLSSGKSLIDRHWILFYWIALNIEYDTVSYFSKEYADQSAETVFQTRKGVCAGYGNLYKHICDELKIPCEIVDGHSKGYGFDDREGAMAEPDHAWNAVLIFKHWFLVESTWAAGSINDKKEFERRLNPYYFLPRPNEMIYHHLPSEDKWQLLRRPVGKRQFHRMPKLRPDYFQYNLELIQPKNQSFVQLEENQPYALVVMKTPTDVQLMADLKLNDQVIVGGSDVVFDKRQRLYLCYFAPRNIGKHKITLLAKRGESDVGSYTGVVDFNLNINQVPENPISYPKKWKLCYDFAMKIMSPLRTHVIELKADEKFGQIILRTPSDVQLMGNLTKTDGQQKIPYSDRVYLDRQQNVWRCKFAPNGPGLFDAMILAKRSSDSESYHSAITFQIDATQLTSPIISFPKTWQLFYDLKMRVVSPSNRAIIVVRDKKKPWAEIALQSSADIDILGQLTDENNTKIANREEIRFDDEKKRWICRFYPDRNAMFNASILAKKISDAGPYRSAIEFQIDARGLPSIPSTHPLRATQRFYSLKIQVISPSGGSRIVLPENSNKVEICLQTPEGIALMGQLQEQNKEILQHSSQVFFDRKEGFWRCQFAPSGQGAFEATILAKENGVSEYYHPIVTYDIIVEQPMPSVRTFPKLFQDFFDYGLEIERPRSSAMVKWTSRSSYGEVLLRAPDEIELSCTIEHGNESLEGGALTQYDHDRQLWQCLFAPKQRGEHQLTIYSKRKDSLQKTSPCVAKFLLNVTELRYPMEFPCTYGLFQTMKCRLIEPLIGTLKKNVVILIHCVIPGATSVAVTIDGKTQKNGGYSDPIFRREITVGQDEVTIYAKYGQSPQYTSLVKYRVI